MPSGNDARSPEPHELPNVADADPATHAVRRPPCVWLKQPDNPVEKATWRGKWMMDRAEALAERPVGQRSCHIAAALVHVAGAQAGAADMWRPPVDGDRENVRQSMARLQDAVAYEVQE